MFVDLPMDTNLALLVIELGAVIASFVVLLLFSIAAVFAVSGIALARSFAHVAEAKARQQRLSANAPWAHTDAHVGRSLLRVAH
jgi:predicted Kef-type K+ transport protein